MTAKEKAKELIEKFTSLEIDLWDKYDDYFKMQIKDAKECALISVGEILNILNPMALDYEYWEEVEQELEK